LVTIMGVFSAAMLPLLFFALFRKERSESLQPKVRMYLGQSIFILICVGSYFFINKTLGLVLFVCNGLAAFLSHLRCKRGYKKSSNLLSPATPVVTLMRTKAQASHSRLGVFLCLKEI